MEIYFLIVLEAEKLEIRVPAGLVPSESSLPGLQMAGCLLVTSFQEVACPWCLCRETQRKGEGEGGKEVRGRRRREG